MQRGHISEGSALIEYGRFRLADVIHRLRTDRADLIPEGKEIVTVHKQDTQGQPYGEYHLVETRSAAARRMVTKVRRQLDTAEHIRTNSHELSLYGSLGPLGD
jgi:hypothetical protein